MTVNPDMRYAATRYETKNALSKNLVRSLRIVHDSPALSITLDFHLRNEN